MFVSSFANREAAEQAVSRVMQLKAIHIAAWEKSTGGAARLELIGDAGWDAGYGISRNTGKLIKMRTVQMFLKREEYNDMPYSIITAYHDSMRSP